MYKIVKYLLNKIIIKKIISKNDLKKRFEIIYNQNYWGDNESISGPGSNKKNSKNITLELRKIIKKYKIKSIVDAPCGDFSWMKKVLHKNKVDYLGVDIVKNLIKENNTKFKNKIIKFENFDILTKRLPKCDLVICRDFLFHLSYLDIKKYFKILKKSKFKYILVSNHANGLDKKVNFLNKDIKSGDFRKINFFDFPFNLKKNYKFFIKDYCDGKKKYLLFYEEKQIKTALKSYI